MEMVQKTMKSSMQLAERVLRVAELPPIWSALYIATLFHVVVWYQTLAMNSLLYLTHACPQSSSCSFFTEQSFFLVRVTESVSVQQCS